MIDPSKENPEEYLDFIYDLSEHLFGLIKSKNDNQRGTHTIEVIGLSGMFYTKKHRKFLLDTLIPTWIQITRAADYKNKAVLDSSKISFEQWMADSYEIAAFTRAFARYYNLEQYGINIP